jgi:N-acetylglucosaminyl-diphospho-decaprenol L-rhamnosyltransferase
LVETSIIIVTYNPGTILFSCLESLYSYLQDSSCEIIIVDNASTDGMIDQVGQVFPGVKIISNTDNRGFAAANNQGLAAARGHYLLLLNPDTRIRNDALSQLQEFLAHSPHAGIVGPRTYDIENRIALSAFGPYTPFSILRQYLGFDRIPGYFSHSKQRRQLEKASEPVAVTWVQGSSMMFRRAVYEQIGGLDEGLFLFSEEPDYCDRALAQGWQTYYVPSAEIEHHESHTISRYPLIKMRHYHLSPLYYFRKRGKNNAVLMLKLGFTLELLVKYLTRLLQMKWQTDAASRARLQAYPVVIKEVWHY